MLFAVFALLGSCLYCLLAIAAALRHVCARGTRPIARAIPISILKPLSGLDDGLEANLRSFFEQEYAGFELLFAVRHAGDPAASVVHRLMRSYPHIDAQLIVTGEPPYPHPKVFSLQRMLDRAKYELIVMSDSDVRVARDFCRTLDVEFDNPRLGLLTCPYRAVPGTDIWSKLEAVGMNTDFHAGVFTALMLDGANFAVGPTIAARRPVLDAIGGIERVKDYLGWEDFMLGRLAAEHGFLVGFSSYVVDHHIGTQSWRRNFAHRLRWARTNRRSRPAGYAGQFFTHPLPLAAFACAVVPAVWPLALAAVLLRAILAWAVSGMALRTPVPWLLLPLQDFLGFGFWIAGFFGSSVRWRGQCYTLNRDGTVRLTP
ncbi:MAG: bacteriohopanetetrol glucosamine biosynthesis glycosyltransferase HpnI [Bryobacteraceae bacterium]